MKKAAYGPPFSFVRELSGFESEEDLRNGTILPVLFAGRERRLGFTDAVSKRRVACADNEIPKKHAAANVHNAVSRPTTPPI
jgi:hypothetical protein